MKEMFAWRVVLLIIQVEWKFTTRENGGLFVTITGPITTPLSYVVSWDIMASKLITQGVCSAKDLEQL